ncbi:hypothetical protein [Roseateles sp. LYH14W]|uniref:DUF3828 domain-containing protein n=1 Tax=Pelomonas parva TaxID=3299032 RepID=A0ABW7EYV9_9BURK
MNDLKGCAALALAASMLTASAAAQTPAAQSTTLKSNSFVAQAEAAYVAHLASEKTGDVALYKQSRAKGAVDEMLANLRQRGMSDKDLPTMLKRGAKYSTPLDGYRLLQADGAGGAGRLFYRKDWKNGETEMVDFLGYVTRWEDGRWKIDCVLNATGTKLGLGSGGKLQERTVDEVAGHRCLSLK